MGALKRLIKLIKDLDNLNFEMELDYLIILLNW